MGEKEKRKGKREIKIRGNMLSNGVKKVE